MFYWLWWEEPAIGAVLDVAVTGKNTVAVTTEADPAALDRLSLLIDERLFDRSQEIAVTVNGTERFRGVVKDTLSTLLRTAAERNDPELLFPARIDL
jgi:hypothetical protein